MLAVEVTPESRGKICAVNIGQQHQNLKVHNGVS